MEWPHCERLNGMATPISCERLDGIDSQIYFHPSSQSIVPSTPTYLLPDSSDRRPTFSACLGGGGGGGGWCCYHSFLTHLRLSCYFHLSYQSDHLARHKIPCSSHGSVPPSFWYHFPRSFPNVPCGIPDICHHCTFSSLMVP